MNYAAISKLAASCFRIPEREDYTALINFEANPVQRRYLGLCQELQKRRRRVRTIVLKPRRVGITTVNIGIGVACIFAVENMEGLTMANLDNVSKDHMSKALLMANGLPVSGVPPWKRGKEVHRVIIPHRNGESYLEGFTARTSDRGRGLGYSFMLLDEAAYYPIMSPFTGVLPTLSKSVEHSYCCLVSTGNGKIGRGANFYNYWQEAGGLDETSENEFVRFFAPWTEDPTAVADERLAADAPRDDEERTLMKIGITRAQLAWRRKQIATDYKGIVEDFNIENPYTPEDAFTATGYPAFAPDELRFMLETVKPPLHVGEFVKESNGRLAFQPRETGRWKIWETPQPGDEYYVGVDAARGFDVDRPDAPPGDFTAIVVWNGSTGWQAARFADRTHPRLTANEVDKVGRYYCTPEISTDHFALLNIELTGNLGREVLRELREVYYYPRHRFARWYGRDDRVHNRPSQGIGWDTTAATRDMMFAAFRNGLHDRRLFVFDEMLMEQCNGATMEESGWDVKRGHDDVMVAGMVTWMTIQQQPPRRIHDAEKRPYETIGKNNPAPDRLPFLESELAQALERDWNRGQERMRGQAMPKHRRNMNGILKQPGVLGGQFNHG